MELQEFIRQSLFEISEGLREANDAYKKSRNTPENAFLLEPGHEKNWYRLLRCGYDKGGDRDRRRAKVGIKVVELSAGRESQQAKESVSRIRFTVMIHYFIG